MWDFYMAFWNKHKETASEAVNKLQIEQVKSNIILNSIDDGVILIDDQKVIRLFNPAAARITGWAQSEAEGLDYHSILKLVDEKNNPYTDDQDPFNRVFTEPKSVRDNKAVLVSKSQKMLAVTLNVSPLLDENKAVIGAVGIFRDVSEERTQERQRAEFISTASHEMRTPVAAIEGYLALAMNENVSKIDAKAREFLEKAHASTKALGDLFQDLLTSAKAEDGRLSNHPQVVEMDQYLEQLTQDLRFAAEKKGLTVEYMVGSSSGPIDARDSNSKVIAPIYNVYADPDRLREVITNLFDNAVKYTDTGKITIGLTGNTQVVQLYIKDTGTGIPAEDIPHLFEKFYRVDNSATRTVGGTGLGLFICRKIIELYRGRIWVESELGKGSTFYINLPRLDDNRAAQLKANQSSNILPEIQGATKI
jgi:PAS domain S-box-containing protein